MLSDASFAYELRENGKGADHLRFLARAYRKISAANARLSIDIFGVVAGGKNVDIQKPVSV
jgi:hypothetical protein